MFMMMMKSREKDNTTRVCSAYTVYKCIRSNSGLRLLTFHRVDAERGAGHLLEFDPTSVHGPFDAYCVV